MKNFILGWLLGKTLSNDDSGDGLVELIGNGILLLFGLAALGIWFKFCEWISSFAGPLGPFIGVFIPFLLIGISQNGVKSKAAFCDMALCYAILTILVLLYGLWVSDYI